jgi:hypothetical protein
MNTQGAATVVTLFGLPHPGAIKQPYNSFSTTRPKLILKAAVTIQYCGTQADPRDPPSLGSLAAETRKTCRNTVINQETSI